LKIADKNDLLIVDGPARTSTGTLEIARVANLVVQPTGVSVDELRPAVREFHALVQAGIARHINDTKVQGQALQSAFFAPLGCAFLSFLPPTLGF
jgi:hypothetical protein